MDKEKENKEGMKRRGDEGVVGLRAALGDVRGRQRRRALVDFGAQWCERRGAAADDADVDAVCDGVWGDVDEDVRLLGVLGVYSRPDRDPRRHTMSVVFVGRPRDAAALKAGDDAARAAFYPLDRLPQPICFDHARILADFGRWLAGERTLAPVEPAGEDD